MTYDRSSYHEFKNNSQAARPDKKTSGCKKRTGTLRGGLVPVR
ncbi:MAG TPA: hypothetical protein VNJ29_02155 [Candidatus Nitrosotenuis sp.]|nr:hypothetical protein [Candidatus Nitrosotenuis sp.]